MATGSRQGATAWSGALDQVSERALSLAVGGGVHDRGMDEDQDPAPSAPIGSSPPCGEKPTDKDHPELDPYYARVGPFYETAGAMHQLDCTEASLTERRSRGEVLVMAVRSGDWLYPAWQFTGKGAVHPQLTPVLVALRGMDGWLAGVWLVSAHPDLDGRSPRQALREGERPAVVAWVAQHDLAFNVD